LNARNVVLRQVGRVHFQFVHMLLSDAGFMLSGSVLQVRF
jgi:hypothetical protein